MSEIGALMGRRAVLAEVVINIKTTRPPLNNNGGGDANVKDAFYCNNRDVDAFRSANMSKI